MALTVHARRWVAAVAVSALTVLAVGCDPAERASPAGRRDTPPPTVDVAPAPLHLTQPRAVHRATLLRDGSVLITGGCTADGCGGFDAGRVSEVYDGALGIVAGPAMGTPRASGTATLLRDGRVLLAGGYPGEGLAPTGSAEVYDPASHAFSPVAGLHTPRADHSATLLPDGRVLVAGGFDPDGRALRTTELFDPATDTFTRGPAMSDPRAAHVATRVGPAVVLVGGTVAQRAVRTTDVLRAGSWSPGPMLRTPRVKLGLAAIGGGRILVVGGARTTEGHRRLASTEVLDLSSGGSVAGPSLAEGEYKLDGAVARLPDGRVVIPSGDALEVFDPRTGLLRRLHQPTYGARSFRTVTPVGDDKVLVAGGYDGAISPTDAAVLITVPPASAAATR